MVTYLRYVTGGANICSGYQCHVESVCAPGTPCIKYAELDLVTQVSRSMQVSRSRHRQRPAKI